MWKRVFTLYQKNVTVSRAAESVFGPQWKSFYGLHIQGGPAKNLYTESERLSVAEWM